MGHTKSKTWKPNSLSYSLLYSLPDEILLNILSFLPMEERCNMARVCRRFNALVRDRALWHTIDVVQVIERHFERMIADPLMLMFDRYHPLQMKYCLLWFLNAYAKNAERLCLTTASRSVLSYVHDNCRNIKDFHVREYAPSTRRLMTALKHLPSDIHTLKIEFPRKFDVLLCDKESNGFVACPLDHLTELTLQGAAIDVSFCNNIAQLPRLGRLRLLWCTMSKHLTLRNCQFLNMIKCLEICCCLFVSFNRLLIFLVEIAQYGTNLITFHFQMPNAENNLLKVDLGKIKSRYRHMLYLSSIDIDPFIYELCQTKSAVKLRNLYFRGNFTLSGPALDTLTQRFDSIEGLSLGDNLLGCMLLTIAKNLRKLKVIDLCKGRFSDSWLHCFQNHPCLQAIRVYQSTRLSCHELCEIIRTLPSMTLLCTTQHEQLKDLRTKNPRILICHSYCQWVRLLDKYVHNEGVS
ncbi:uncharacterized protein [Amphiura filiformis]|uniref:uncharacterized protein n=1 Tax=Amphiura filiformis TaxID=82378 RepID=UPI003B21AF20